MANNRTISYIVSKNVLFCSIVFKFIAMAIGFLGNVTLIIYTIFSSKEKTVTSYLVGNLALADLLMCLTFYPICGNMDRGVYSNYTEQIIQELY